MVDRNQAAREREHAQRMFNQDLAKFTRLLNEGKTGLVDRFGVQITPRDLVLYHPDWDLVFDVGEITPVMDPSQPVGALNMKLTCTVNVKFMAGIRSMNLIHCGRRPEPTEADGNKPPDPQLSMPGSEPPADLQSLDASAAGGEGEAAPPAADSEDSK